MPTVLRAEQHPVDTTLTRIVCEVDGELSWTSDMPASVRPEVRLNPDGPPCEDRRPGKRGALLTPTAPTAADQDLMGPRPDGR